VRPREGALRITDGKVRLLAEKFCDGCGACVAKCPLGALKVVEREADEWQELVYVRC
jgi:NAD-dependent dihydropyrimidine dehydrogenase PreA subunit